MQPYQQNRIYDTDGLCPSLNAGQEKWKGNIVNTKQIRRLTPWECWKLQGFSKSDFEKAESVVSNSQLYKQVRKHHFCSCDSGNPKKHHRCIGKVIGSSPLFRTTPQEITDLFVKFFAYASAY